MPMSDEEREKLGKMLNRFNESGSKPTARSKKPDRMTKRAPEGPGPSNYSEAMMKRLRDENGEILREAHLIRGGDNCCPNDRCKKRDGFGILNIMGNPDNNIPEHIGIATFNEHQEEANVCFIGMEQAKKLVNALTVAIAVGELASGVNIDPFKKADC